MSEELVVLREALEDFYNAENMQKVAEKTRERVFIASRLALPISLVLD